MEPTVDMDCLLYSALAPHGYVNRASSQVRTDGAGICPLRMQMIPLCTPDFVVAVVNAPKSE